jgi:hypothetical protein
MTDSRRDFIGRLALGTAALGGLPLALSATARTLEASAPHAADAAPGGWDLSWTDRIRGRHKVVFDVPEIESGYGVWRASIWAAQYEGVLGIPARELSAVVVLRHNAIVLAMQQAFWDRHALGREKGVTHPVTQQPTDRNPALLSSARGEQPANFDAFALDRFIARGGIALACDLAFQDVVALVQAKEQVSAEVARARALEQLVPGVVMQPSGVFAAIHAQDAGCRYLRAS